MIAHNNTFKKVDYEQVCILVSELKEKIQKAMDNLDKVQISQEDKEVLAENAASNINALYGEFIQEYKKLEMQLLEIAIMTDKEKAEKYKFSTRIMLESYLEKGIINKSIYKEFRTLIDFRNVIVHHLDLHFSQEEITNRILLLKRLINHFKAVYEGLTDETESCSECGKYNAEYLLSSGEPICEKCSQNASKYEICTTCGLVFPWGEINQAENKCFDCLEKED